MVFYKQTLTQSRAIGIRNEKMRNRNFSTVIHSILKCNCEYFLFFFEIN